MRRTLSVAAGVLAVLSGCHSHQAKPADGEAYPVSRIPPPSAQPQTGEAAPAPSLEEERQSQAQRAAEALSKKTGVELERAGGAGPAWWPRGSAGGNGFGKARASSLERAFQHASGQAAGNDHTTPIGRAAYARLAMGDYMAWVEVGKAGAPAWIPPPAPVNPVVTTTPALAPTPAPTPKTSQEPASKTTPAQAASGQPAPVWFLAAAKEESGRVIIGGTADAATEQEAPRLATQAGMAALAAATGAALTDLRVEATYVEKVGNKFRAYVLVSSEGTIKK